jgi:ribosomal-protein-alanine N-acetyltransferase
MLGIERAAATAARWAEADYAKAFTETSLRRMVLVAERNAEVQGFLAARSAHPSEWEIENVVVAEPARRTRLGGALLQAFIERAHAEELPTGETVAIFLEVRESNLAARLLYEKSGFLMEGSRPGYYHNPEESAVVYRRVKSRG